MKSRVMNLSKQFQLAYDVHMCRMIPQLVIILEGEMTHLTKASPYNRNRTPRDMVDWWRMEAGQRIVIQRRMEDLQLGVKSYQKKLNLTKPDTFRPDLRNKTAFTTYSKPQGVIYKDQNNRNRLMRTDELYKFSDGTLNYVRTALHDITSGIRMEYLPKKKWSRLDKRRAHVMIQDIDKQLRDVKNKKDERGIVIRNKARLVAQGYTQEEGIDYDEVFAHVARIEAIRLFLAYASFKDFVVYQMDVKSAFLYGKIEEKVYVCQPPGFEDPEFPDRVYKVEKYETLSTYMLDNEFQRGKIDKTLFIKRYKGDILLQKKDGIFISQDKYVGEILKKFRFTEVKTASTPMENQKPLLKDEDAEEVDVHMYRLMIGSLTYLTSSRPDTL
ncbi:putative ribonuclease H-like domain-containing protein [Tanacetum coccineum]